MITNRVKFYGANDFLYGHNLEKIESISIPTDSSGIDINDAIEFYEIKRYFDDGVHLKSWSDPLSN